ncbi:MAG: MFS transporter [Holosporaceae bacterium]|jgi:acyl-[acyl-carrier-protein]-phospholipid O-acyltransferase/long-chain-fatty-acid--[acyl-carrier-protein] ligase|nr:MFS transporter [Rhodospirillaceae bacterium]
MPPLSFYHNWPPKATRRPQAILILIWLNSGRLTPNLSRYNLTKARCAVTLSYRQLLSQRGFMAYLISESMGIYTDNLFKILLTFLAINQTTGAQDSGLVAWIGAIFIAPYLIFSGLGGRLADRYDKRTVLIASKMFELVSMILATLALASGHTGFMIGVLLLTAVQSALNSPAKFAIIPEMVAPQQLARANGLMQMTLYISIILGTVSGGLFFEVFQDRLAMVGIILLSLTALSAVLVFWIPRRPPLHAPATKGSSIIALGGTLDACRSALAIRPIRLAIWGISWFWFIGALMQMLLVIYGHHELGVGESATSQLLMFLLVGIAGGSLIGGWLSGDHVELGLIPLGGIALTIGLVLLGFAAPSYGQAAVSLVLIGVAGGVYIVPLNAFLQHSADPTTTGKIMAACNVFNTVGMLAASLALKSLYDGVGLTASQIMLVLAVASLLTCLYLIQLLPQSLLRLVVLAVVRLVYRIRVIGANHLPIGTDRPALYVANHVSFVDGLLVGAALNKPLRYVMLDRYYNIWWLKPLFRLMGVIPMATQGKAMIKSLDQARTALLAGDSVCIFPEGALSRNGNMAEFRPGFSRILSDLPDVPIIPVYLDGVWGSIFSASPNRKGQQKFLWKWPRRLPYAVTVSFGQPLPADTPVQAVKQAVAELSAAAYRHHPDRQTSLALAFVRSAKQRLSQLAIRDSSGRSLSYGQSLTGALLLADYLRRYHGQEKFIGIALPASVGGALINLACALAGKVPINLNFTVGQDAIMQAVGQCRISTVITSEKLLKKIALPGTVVTNPLDNSLANASALPHLILMESLLTQLPLHHRLRAWLTAYMLPSWLLQHLLRHRVGHGSDLATILFSSGSTGTPKGVMLSQDNLLANIASAAQILPLKPKDTMVGILPFFHSFGFTGTLWLPLLTGLSVAYHPNPLEAKAVGQLIAQSQAKLLIATPTFCQLYARNCTADQLQSLRHVVVGSEKLRTATAEEFKQKFGLELLEGYGCTELSPIAAVNLPNISLNGYDHQGNRPGTVGHPIPYVAARITDLDSGQVLHEPNKPGLLWIKGPNVMQGYYEQPDRTAQVLQDGWYNTGDIAQMDAAGFITLIDRLSRFAKLGGEMVPLIRIEEALHQLAGTSDLVAIALSDPQKGERVVIAHTDTLDISQLDSLLTSLRTILPPLWVPRRDSFVRLATIPLLSTGKTDIQGVKTAVIGAMAAD